MNDPTNQHQDPNQSMEFLFTKLLLMIDIPMGKRYNIKIWKFITNINSLKEHFYFLLFMPLRALNICSQSGQTSLMHTALTANCGLASYFPLKWYQAHSTLLYASTVRVTSVIRLCDSSHRLIVSSFCLLPMSFLLVISIPGHFLSCWSFLPMLHLQTSINSWKYNTHEVIFLVFVVCLWPAL